MGTWGSFPGGKAVRITKSSEEVVAVAMLEGERGLHCN
jgi:hypothetical protein